MSYHFGALGVESTWEKERREIKERSTSSLFDMCMALSRLVEDLQDQIAVQEQKIANLEKKFNEIKDNE